jgi:hypothetical protein
MTDGIKIGELYTELVLNKAQYMMGLNEGEKATKSFASKTRSSITGAAKIITAALLSVGASVITFGEQSIVSAEKQERADKKTEMAFGRSGQAAIDWAKTNAMSFAVADDVIEQSTSAYQLWATNVGKSSKQATKDGQELAKRAAEIAQTTGGNYTDIFNALLKGEQGATKGLKGYGVAVSVASIKQEAFKLGLYSGKGALSDTAKAAALHAIIMQQTAKYTTAAASSQDLLALKTKRIGVVFDEVKDTVGKAFVIIVSGIFDAVMPAFQGLLAWVQKNGPAIQAMILNVFNKIRSAIQVVVDAVKPLVDALVGFVQNAIVPFLQQGNNFNDLLIALGAIVMAAVVPPFLAWAAATVVALAPIIAVAAAVAGVVMILDHFGLLGPIVTAVTTAIGVAMQWVSDNVVPALTAAFNWIVANVIPALGAAFQWVIDNVVPALGAAFQWIIDNVLPVIGAAFDFFATTIIPALGVAFQWIIDNVIPALGTAFQWIVDNIFPPLQAIFETFTTVVIPALAEAFQGIMSWVQSNMPLLQSIFEAVFGVVKEVVGIAADAVAAAFHVIAEVIKDVAPIIKSVGEVVFPILGDAATALGVVIKTAFDLIGSILGTFKTVTETVIAAVGTAWDLLGKGIGAAWDGIANGVKGGLNIIIGAINTLIRALDGIQIHIPEVGVGPVHTPAMDWNGLNLPTIPLLAKGMYDVPTAMPAILHQHEAVLTAGQADAWRKGRGMAGAGDSIQLNANFYVTKDQSPEQFARESLLALKREVKRQGMSLA